MEDSSIIVYIVRLDKVICTLTGHGRRVTGLAFSSVLLVSSTAEAQNGNARLLRSCRFLENMQQILLLKHQTLVLVVHESKIAIHELLKMDRLYKWIVGKLNVEITDATYSSDGELVYASFKDSSIVVFTAPNLTMRCQINYISYLLYDYKVMHMHPHNIT